MTRDNATAIRAVARSTALEPNNGSGDERVSSSERSSTVTDPSKTCDGGAADAPQCEKATKPSER